MGRSKGDTFVVFLFPPHLTKKDGDENLKDQGVCYNSTVKYSPTPHDCLPPLSHCQVRLRSLPGQNPSRPHARCCAHSTHHHAGIPLRSRRPGKSQTTRLALETNDIEKKVSIIDHHSSLYSNTKNKNKNTTCSYTCTFNIQSTCNPSMYFP